MPYIKTNNDIAGIRGLMTYRPKTGAALQALAESLLVEDSLLSRFDRELIATYVSSRNNCQFCTQSHAAIAEELAPPEQKHIVGQMLEDFNTALLNKKQRSLLNLAALVQKSGQSVSQFEIDEIKKSGIQDEEIHDTVLIAAAFCMFNRYVEGLGAELPSESSEYRQNAKILATKGYIR